MEKQEEDHHRDPGLKACQYSSIGHHFYIMKAIEERIFPKPVKLITAACKNMGIGVKGNLPWNLPKEFKYLLDTITTVSDPGKKNLIMWGRTSFQSFPESLFPLRNTVIAVLSRTLSCVPKHASYICHNVDEVLKLASTPPLSQDIETVWVLGGVKSYKETIQHPWCDSIYFTNIMADFECDTFFPEFDKEVFKLVQQCPGVPSGIQEENGIKYEFQVYKRNADLKMLINI